MGHLVPVGSSFKDHQAIEMVKGVPGLTDSTSADEKKEEEGNA